ncbi:hypothetical protein KPL71_014422 [Citrus sinensis]|nr:hypothetical protein KPL71_014422 [Citrus sinensis]
MRSLLNGLTCSLKYMPIGISKLTSLRTLDKFAVGGGVDGGSTCRLECLKNFQLIRKCGIEGLSNVSHLDEAERLELKNMENLLHLYLWFEVVDREDEDWEDEEENEDEGGEDEDEDGGYKEEKGGKVVDGEYEERRRKNEKDEQLLEALQPPLNVEKLWILFNGGNILPKWLTSLTNLSDLKLVFCENCEQLPPLGKLPLEKLELCHLKSVKRVGNEFLEIEESEDDPSSSSSSSSVTAFPKVKSLEIKELEEGNYRITRKENISIIPRLSSLRI